MLSALIGLDSMYPVGAIYLSVASTNPSTLFGGTWEQIKDTFLLCAGDTYSAGSTGGAATHTLTTDEIPSHTHGLNSHTHDAGSYSAVSNGSHGNHVNNYGGDSRFYLDSGRFTQTSGLSLRPWNFDGSKAYIQTQSGGGHTHSITGSSGVASGDTAAKGGGTAHNNMPPYLTIYCWKRIA